MIITYIYDLELLNLSQHYIVTRNNHWSGFDGMQTKSDSLLPLSPNGHAIFKIQKKEPIWRLRSNFQKIEKSRLLGSVGLGPCMLTGPEAFIPI